MTSAGGRRCRAYSASEVLSAAAAATVTSWPIRESCKLSRIQSSTQSPTLRRPPSRPRSDTWCYCGCCYVSAALYDELSSSLSREDTTRILYTSHDRMAPSDTANTAQIKRRSGLKMYGCCSATCLPERVCGWLSLKGCSWRY